MTLKRRDHFEEIPKSGEVMDGIETMKTKLKKKGDDDDRLIR